MFQSLYSIKYFFLIIVGLIFMFSLMSMELFAYTFGKNDNTHRFKFNNISSSIESIIMFFLNEEWYFILYEHANINSNKSIIFLMILFVLINILSKLFVLIIYFF